MASRTTSLDARTFVSRSGQPWDKEYILHDADAPKDLIKDEDLNKGVTLHRETQIFRKVDNLEKNWFMVLPKGLTIAWIDDPLYWHRKPATDLCSIAVQVAELRNIRWLDIAGKFVVDTLSRNTKYQIFLHAKLTEKENTGCDELKYDITLPNGAKITEEKQVKLKLDTVDSWQPVPLHEFHTKEFQNGEVKFRIYNHSDSWKRGFVLGGVSFQPLSSEPPSSSTSSSNQPTAG